MQYVTSTQISKYRNLRCYLVFLPLENAKKTQTGQSMLHVSLLCLKKTTHKPIKVAAAKNLFSSGYVFGSTYFDEYFLFHMITGKQYFS